MHEEVLKLINGVDVNNLEQCADINAKIYKLIHGDYKIVSNCVYDKSEKLFDEIPDYVGLLNDMGFVDG